MEKMDFTLVGKNVGDLMDDSRARRNGRPPEAPPHRLLGRKLLTTCPHPNSTRTPSPTFTHDPMHLHIPHPLTPRPFSSPPPNHHFQIPQIALYYRPSTYPICTRRKHTPRPDMHASCPRRRPQAPASYVITRLEGKNTQLLVSANLDHIVHRLYRSLDIPHSHASNHGVYLA